MKFHPEKCNVLTISKKRSPSKYNYTLHDHISSGNVRIRKCCQICKQHCSNSETLYTIGYRYLLSPNGIKKIVRQVSAVDFKVFCLGTFEFYRTLFKQFDWKFPWSPTKIRIWLVLSIRHILPNAQILHWSREDISM